MTKRKTFSAATNNEKGIKAVKAVFSHFPDMHEETKKFLIALTDKTEGLSQNVVVVMEDDSELREKICNDLQKLNYGDHADTIETYLHKNGAGGGFCADHFTGIPKAGGIPKWFLGNECKPLREGDPKDRKFVMVWFTTNFMEDETIPPNGALVINLIELDYKNAKLSQNVQRKDTSSWDRIQRDFG